MRNVIRAWCSLASIALLPMLSTAAGAQAVRITATPIEPFEFTGAQQQGRRERDRDQRERDQVDVSRFLSLYATAFLGTPGTVEGLAPDAKRGVHYPTVHLVLSAAARPRPRGGEVAVARGLHRLNAHVRVEPQDSASRPIDAMYALEVLAISPDSIGQMARATDTTKVVGAAFKAVTRILMPEVPAIVSGQGKRLGPMIAKFGEVFHRPSAPTQVAYLSDHREFGWVWYQHPELSIEGTHRASAIFEAAPSVRYLRVEILLVADWERHGAWQRRFEIVLDMGAGGS